MKIRLQHPAVIKFAAMAVGWLVRLWLGTLEYFFLLDDPSTDPLRASRRMIYIFWHEMMLFPAYTHARRGFSMLIGLHRDGELIAQVVRMMRGHTVRGSTTRGGLSALRGMMRQGRTRHLAITPDGPKGPRRVVQQGCVYVAVRTGMPIVPVGFAFGDCWRAGSWDRMALPRPFRPARCVIGRAIDIPAELDESEIGRYLAVVQAAMDDVQARAEALADAGVTSRPLIGAAEMFSTMKS